MVEFITHEETKCCDESSALGSVVESKTTRAGRSYNALSATTESWRKMQIQSFCIVPTSGIHHENALYIRKHQT